MSDSHATPSPRCTAYARWIASQYRAILAISCILLLAAGAVAAQLPVHADFSYLLPPRAEAVQHLRALEKRAHVLGTLMLAVKSDDPAQREAVAQSVRQQVAALPDDLVSSVEVDRHVARRFAWENRWLFASTQDLAATRDALRGRMNEGFESHNPLAIDLDAPATHDDTSKSLIDRLKEAEKAQSDPGEYVSPDGKLQLLIVHTPFSAGDIGRDTALIAAVEPILAAAMTEHPAVQVGMAGDVISSRAEQRSILFGMLTATALTIALVVLGLLAYYRSLAGVAALSWSLAVGAITTFMVTRLTIGHLNLATAFLASIVVGNGINFGIMLLARYFEALRAHPTPSEPLAVAIGDTLHGTFAAALTACVAYLSLIATDFRGFRDFGYIGGIGMMLCWVSAYTVLPAALVWIQRRGWLRATPEPPIGPWLSRMLPKRVGWVIAVATLVLVAASSVAWHYLTHDPYEANFQNLRSDSAEIEHERHWMHEVDVAFGQGISGGFVIGAPDRDTARKLFVQLRALDEGRSREEKLFSRVNALDEGVPTDQDKKLIILGEIRTLLNDPRMQHAPPRERALYKKVRPPEQLRPLTDADIPAELAWPFTEVDGSRGKLLLAMPGWGYQIWNAHDLIRWVDQVRNLHLGHDTLLGGSAFVFADMLRMVEHDGPKATLVATVGAILVVLVMVGARVHGRVTMLCGLFGTTLMLAAVAVLGLRVNFLDFVALPITIGIGIDYAVNICARHRLDPTQSARHALATAGGAVFLASYTTIIGYGSLLLSSNKGIRSFGTAAIIGEITCLVVALVVAPALLDLRRNQPPK